MFHLFGGYIFQYFMLPQDIQQLIPSLVQGIDCWGKPIFLATWFHLKMHARVPSRSKNSGGRGKLLRCGSWKFAQMHFTSHLYGIQEQVTKRTLEFCQKLVSACHQMPQLPEFIAFLVETISRIRLTGWYRLKDSCILVAASPSVKSCCHWMKRFDWIRR
jgi:hypothetical protein